MTTTCKCAAEIKVFLNHLYEYRKGVRNMVLYTMPVQYLDFVEQRLQKQSVDYCIQPINSDRINLFFGRPECIAAIRHMTRRPLNELTPEEDFILGAMLGYDICGQCRRYCERRRTAAGRQAFPERCVV